MTEVMVSSSLKSNADTGDTGLHNLARFSDAWSNYFLALWELWLKKFQHGSHAETNISGYKEGWAEI